ncbi:regulatory protein RecX [Novosphingobium album (ex Hu et al. 2023)]|uniref:RecX family transcriptional regulator n=1 Tax=Novosphingobium album (ex Hu et al. 2023) TaxID=2930093 RepID=A0ABT0B192_9SPHN|nr:RecX family transcriptional regulator [Novosphingobium album (ex Hu et al. 2023)]MCJ2178804.1 RecX family transcriptional regulator [Novosphingobium album (ex Hu et al. 2023)]
MSVKRRNPQPLNGQRLEELALAYVARFATTQARLHGYLQRKIRERGWDGEGQPPVEALVSRYAELGYVDDAAWARMKAGSLLRRGYGVRRVGEALGQAGIEEGLRAETRPGERDQRRAALVLARRRRFGPFAIESPDRAAREKQLAAMLRAGHSLDIARRIVDAPDPGEAEEWAESAYGDD